MPRLWSFRPFFRYLHCQHAPLYLSRSAHPADDVVDQMLATGGQCAEGQLRAATAYCGTYTGFTRPFPTAGFSNVCAVRKPDLIQ
ncbi:TPA: hypothetical protein N3Z72_005057 [Salmonella enterica subsp. enterica serovar 6,14:y:1,7]|nr:hypothetical protein [Salmonella enterica]HCM6306682.1 hypothetical protein [Salmonella enterica subsp. enterica serovar 6,14:y:1,7]